MAHQEHNGSGRSSETGPGPAAGEHVEPDRSAGDPEEYDPDAAAPGPTAPEPSPHDQWFGGFEGEAPPPPPYARLPEDTPLPGAGHHTPSPPGGAGGAEAVGGELERSASGDPEPSGLSAVPEPEGLPEEPETEVLPPSSVTSEPSSAPGIFGPPETPEDSGVPGSSGTSRPLLPPRASGASEFLAGSEAAETAAAAEDDADTEDGEEEGTVRLVPGAARRRPQRPQRQRLQRPTRPGEDPLAPRRPRRDPDVPEPEQLPPLENERDDAHGGPRTTGPVPTGTETGSGPTGSGPFSFRGPGSSPVRGPGDNGPGPDSGPRSARDTGLGAWLGEDSGPFRSAPPPGEPVRPAPLRTPEPPSALTGPRADLAPPPPPPAPQGSPDRRPEQERQTSDALNAATLVRNRRQGPSGGWRRAVHAATLGLVNPGESAKVLRQRELVARASTPVAAGHHRVAVLSLKGGVGKTTTTVALGATLASLRGDRVLAVDANPDRGTLSDKVRLETAATIRDLLNERHLVSRYADIRGFTSQAPSRLEILASDRDPAVSEAFSDADYREVARIVEHFYSICITDCGTGLLHSAMRGVLGLADQVVLVSSASVDGARSASATLDWLEAHGHGSLVRNAVVVLSMVRSDSKSSVDLNRLEEHFAGRCRDVVRVPWDGHLEEGAEVDLERLAPATRDAYLQLAASVGEAFAWQR
ncbi:MULTISPECIES: MinD/ParA family ATP-binding protein [Nocardiopsis]|uniref:ATPase involved in chromosome partitioning-like protein n=2 Tax=Nocardiopsis TaxID=2013 RepID=D7B8Z7_NOCDD|nr:MinD/ParA family protein [Nocardiopsis dassonvillei]ADH70655.1 ATPase involved in chromosome partitioning-like protein [Nocardiopsis dassonvillei subsp. dassonvillei DSM 43111]VEI90864.1 Flp pilus assembly protein, ATPase CpaE [Nocardiopsis dassonvillei]